LPTGIDIDYAKLAEKLREELAPVRVIVDYGYGYRCWPSTSLRGETVFTVATSVPGEPPVCKVFKLEGFSEPVEIGDLYAFDSRNTTTGQPFITLDGSILVPCWSVDYYATKKPWLAIYRYANGAWSKVYEDASGSYCSHIAQDHVTRALYTGYHQPATYRSRVIKSTDDGATWALVYDNAEVSSSNAIIYSCAAFNNNVIATKRDKHTYIRSSNGGGAWTESGNLGANMRTVAIYYDLGLSFIGSDNYLFYSRDYFATYKRIRIQSGTGFWAFRYPIRVGGRLLLSTDDGRRSTVILASRDLYHTVTPVFSVESSGSNFPRISGYGDFLFVGSDYYGTLTRITLPKTLERGLSCPILLWENESVTDTTNGSTTDYVEAEYNNELTFTVISNQSGTLYIQAYDEVAGSFRDVDSKPVSANTLTAYNVTQTHARLMRVRFVPSASATVSCWVVLR
jgi:hypothetical protein